MCRSIKFRVWSKEHKQWMNHCSVIDSGGNTLALFYEQKENGQLLPIVFECPPDSVVIQQFTGLFDSQGKEIYEGDIMLYPNGLPYVVKFGEYSYCDLMTVELNGWYITNEGWEWPLDSSGKVVGNVFETPELLK